MCGFFLYKIEKLLPRSKLFLISSRKVCQIVKKVSEMKNVEKYNWVPTKGQLISKCPFGPKHQRKNLTNSALESEKWSSHKIKVL